MLKINDPNLDALTLRIAQGIPQTQFFFGLSRHDIKWAKEASNSLDQGTNAYLKKICDGDGLDSFLSAEINYILERCPDYDGDIGFLSEISAFKDSIKVAGDLSARLRSLPYKYRMAAQLPPEASKLFKGIGDRFEIGQGLSIQVSQHLRESFPEKTGCDHADRSIYGSDLIPDSSISSDDQYFLCFYRSGYIGRQSDPLIVSEFRNVYRQVIGILLASRTISYLSHHFAKWDPAYTGHRLDGNTEVCFFERFDPRLVNLGASIKASKAGVASEIALESLKAAFAEEDKNKGLPIAAMWFLRSFLSGASLDALLELTIALEALFGGGPSETGKLSAILANRCAYSIAHDYNDREKILADFAEIYKLRSSIVHTGHHSFTAGERELLEKARSICSRSLGAELNLASSPLRRQRRRSSGATD